jgi:hypothetical protein
MSRNQPRKGHLKQRSWEYSRGNEECRGVPIQVERHFDSLKPDIHSLSGELKKLASVTNQIPFVGEPGIEFVTPTDIDEDRREAK